MNDLPGNTREKSYLLFNLMEWELRYGRPINDHTGRRVSVTEFTWSHEDGKRWVDLYYPKNFNLSWRCLGWFEMKMSEDPTVVDGFGEGLPTNLLFYARMSPEEAQTTILDQILKACIEAGLVDALTAEKEVEDEG